MLKKFFAVVLLVCSFVVYGQEKPDALKRYFNGRTLDAKGRKEDAVNEYNAAIQICLDELEVTPQNMDAYAVYAWSLYRLKKYADTVSICRQALNIREDARIVETMGEALFYLNRFDESLAQMQRYISLAPAGDSVGVAYFFEAEIYRLRKLYNKAEIAYTAAVFFEPNLSLWWYRLGLMREILENKAGAIEAFERAIKLAPNYTDALNGLKRLQN